MPKTFDRRDSAESPDSAAEGMPDAHDSPLRDKRRLHALERSGLLGGVANPVLDRVARLTAGILGVPIALVSLVDDQRQHFPGLAGLGGWAGTQRGTTLSHSFCQHVVTSNEALVVPDASSHPSLRDHLAFKDLGVVAYAGVPLRTEQGETLGALCAIDVQPVQWTTAQIALLEDLSALAMAEIELRALSHDLSQEQSRYTAQADRDTLTGLLNRRGFAAISRARYALALQGGTPFSIVSVSLNGFRHVNAQYGDDVGDHALIDIAALLTTVVQSGDVVARRGSDEFTLMIAEPRGTPHTDIESAINGALAVLNAEIGRELVLEASVGVARWSPDRSQALTAVMQCADDAMVRQKRQRHAGRAA